MSLKAKYSPPYTVSVLDEQTLTFKRMLRAEWIELSEQIKTELVEAESARINTEGKELPSHERALIRTRMRDHFEQEVTQSRVIRDCSNTPKGIDRLLKFSLVEKDRAEWLDLIDAAQANEIVEQIVYMPKVVPTDPPKLPPPNEASGGGSEADVKNPTGEASPPTSSPPSPASTPTA